MSDIVERLRDTGMYGEPDLVRLCREAADEIERLWNECVDARADCGHALNQLAQARNRANHAGAASEVSGESGGDT